MRILYGVFGHGRGHATRALGVLPDLLRRHAVLVLAGGDAYETLRLAGFPVTEIDTLTYAYGRDGRRCIWRSILGNARQLADLPLGGERVRRVMSRASDFAPDLVIADAEPFTHAAAARLGIPRISFDHFGVLIDCRPAIPRRDRLCHWRDVAAYRILMGRPDRVLVSSFFPAPPRSPAVRLVGPVVRDEVLRQTGPRRLPARLPQSGPEAARPPRRAGAPRCRHARRHLRLSPARRRPESGLPRPRERGLPCGPGQVPCRLLDRRQPARRRGHPPRQADAGHARAHPHYPRIDKPFLDAQGRRLENFTRIETFGDNQGNGTNDVQWIKVTVDSRSREVFSFQPQIVPGNRVAVPPP